MTAVGLAMQREATVANVPMFRALLVTLSLLVLQVAILSHARVSEVQPDVMLLLTVSVALERGLEAGALVGFIAGLSFDLFVDTPFGLSSLIYGVVGVAVGFGRDRVLPGRQGISYTFVAAASVAATTSFALSAYLLDGVPLYGPMRLAKVAIVVTVWNVTLARPLAVFVRRSLGGRGG